MNTLGRQFSAVSTRAARDCRRRKWNVCATTLPSTSSRSVHTRRELHYPIEEGVGDFLPPPALKTVVEWQEGLLERFNDQVRGTAHANKTVLQTVIDTAGDKEKIRTYNYGALAANNSFFLDNIKPPSGESNEKELDADLKGTIALQFYDLNGLQERFVASASGMVTSGWLWLVTDGQKQLAVVPTFGSGTLLIRSRETWAPVQQITLARQLQGGFTEPTEYRPSFSGVLPPSQDGPSPSSPVSGVRGIPPNLNPHTSARSLSTSAALLSENPSVRDENAGSNTDTEASRKAAQSIGSRVYPLFCLSIHEHAWMSAGLGVWGKEEYVRRFFSVVDWKKVSETYAKFSSTQFRGSQTISQS